LASSRFGAPAIGLGLSSLTTVYRFWSSVVEPVFQALAPDVIVEIGADKGAHTRRILDYCKAHGAVAHVIDPLPRFNVPAWQEEYGEAFVFHQQLSLEALPSIEAMDVVLIDGDHNWYTVFNELRLIQRSAENARMAFPVVFLHDVDWPYGRRDLYYDPDTIPDRYRHPHQRAGLRPGKEELSGSGGLNANVANAVSENTERNGVRTALEDFISESELDFRLVVVPGWHGLGILAARSFVDTHRSLAELLARFESADFLAEHCRRIESTRIRTMIRAHEKKRLLKRRVRDLEKELSDNRDLTPGGARKTQDRFESAT
jgi:hypothetical protein